MLENVPSGRVLPSRPFFGFEGVFGGFEAAAETAFSFSFSFSFAAAATTSPNGPPRSSSTSSSSNLHQVASRDASLVSFTSAT